MSPPPPHSQSQQHHHAHPHTMMLWVARAICNQATHAHTHEDTCEAMGAGTATMCREKGQGKAGGVPYTHLLIRQQGVANSRHLLPAAHGRHMGLRETHAEGGCVWGGGAGGREGGEGQGTVRGRRYAGLSHTGTPYPPGGAMGGMHMAAEQPLQLHDRRPRASTRGHGGTRCDNAPPPHPWAHAGHLACLGQRYRGHVGTRHRCKGLNQST
jgi:hypothetical protein